MMKDEPLKMTINHLLRLLLPLLFNQIPLIIKELTYYKAWLIKGTITHTKAKREKSSLNHK